MRLSEKRNESKDPFVSVQQCRICGSIIPLMEGVNGHKELCGLVDKMPHNQMATIKFPCPIVKVEKSTQRLGHISSTEQQSSSSGSGRESKPENVVNVPEIIPPYLLAPPPRRASIRAMEIVRNALSNEVKLLNGHRNDSPPTLKRERDDDNDFKMFEDEPNKGPVARGRKLKIVPRRQRKMKPRKPMGLDNYYGLRCSECPARFNDEEVLKRHEDCVHGEESKGREILTCPVCGRMFHVRLIFQSHIKNHENAEAVEDTFNLWKTWPKGAKKKTFTCSCKYCVIPIKSHDMFLNHMKTDHSDKSRSQKYSCAYCTDSDKEYVSMKLLFQHIQTFHVREYYGTDRKNMGPVHCKVCERDISYNYYPAHVKRKHSSALSESIPGRLMKVEKPDNIHSCPLTGCEAKLKTAAQLKSHFIIHLENNPYKCPVPDCKVRCDALCHLKRHMELHTGKAGVKCEKCGLHFSRKDRLKKHICSDGHPKKKVFRSGYYDNDNDNGLRSQYAHLRLQRIPESTANELMPKESIDINPIFAADPVFIKTCKENPGFRDLILGGKMREGEQDCPDKEFKCSKCPKSFGALRTLQSHITLKHKPRPYKCSKCGTTFTNRSTLLIHMKSHDLLGGDVYMVQTSNGNWQCTKCKKDSAHQGSIRRHWFLKHNVTLPKLQEQRDANKAKNKTATKSKLNKKRISKREYDSNSKLDPEWSQGGQDEKTVTIDTSIVKIESEPPIKLELTLTGDGDVKMDSVNSPTEATSENIDDDSFHNQCEQRDSKCILSKELSELINSVVKNET